MKILIYSPMFYPNIGGLEMMVSILGDEFVRNGHDVKLVSTTPAAEESVFPFEVIRCPGPGEFLRLAKWCDVFFQANVSLKGIWPLLVMRKPLALTHQGWYCRSNGRVGFRDFLKQRITRFAQNISASQSVADHLSAPSTVVPNSYREELFYPMPGISRGKDLVFLGRLVSEKGVDILLDALKRLKAKGLVPNLTIIGSGPEENRLREQAKCSGVNAQVTFAGLKTGTELSRLLNEHQIMVVPSRLNEPFGIVALEGIACGCVIVGSEGGGLKDAIGPCGVTFPNGDVSGLTQTLSELLENKQRLTEYRSHAEAHLRRHRKEEVAKSYLRVFETLVKSGPGTAAV